MDGRSAERLDSKSAGAQKLTLRTDYDLVLSIDLRGRMFDRFSTRATRVLFHARSEAGQLGSRAIEPEHILLGILDEGGGLGSRILARTGDELCHLRSEILGRLASREKVPETDELQFSASCQRALQCAVEEADRLSHDHIGTEHLLLGLLYEEQSVAAEVLAGRGVRVDAVREAIAELLAHGEEPEPPGPPGTPANTYKWPWIPLCALANRAYPAFRGALANTTCHQ